ncbi:YeiH family protein [Bacillus testis]|uniref:YeiH family protein n=1 Tax=Bacillus testis TaxID=1622072 RepID=UPI00067EE2EB|nr:putative sulfate exporter family transporter [Bacillus testis]
MSAAKKMHDEKRQLDEKPMIFGVAFTFGIALIGYLLAQIPGVSMIGQMGCAIILAVIYRQVWGYPVRLKKGIAFSSKILLRLAIILYGLKLNIAVLISEGPVLLWKDMLFIAFSILLMLWLSKYFKGNDKISMLLGVGTGICGAAAIVAIAPIIQSDDDETAISVGIIALVGTLFAIIYTLARPLLPLDPYEYAIWSGFSLHELGHVALAADPAGEGPLAMALLAKLGRVFFLVPLCFIFVWIFSRKDAAQGKKQKLHFPYFLIGFVIMSVIGSFVLGIYIPVSAAVLTGIGTFTTWCLTAAMVGLGLNIHLAEVRRKALKPLYAMLITSVCLSILSYILL